MTTNTRADLTRYAWLSIAAAVLTIGLKLFAWQLTGAVSLFSDALESIVNLVAASIALVALSVAGQPPDDEHAYGHDKAELFSGGAEGALIIVAAIGIVWAAIERLQNPQMPQDVGIGTGIAAVASLINLGTALILMRVGKAHRSMTLEADARHLLADVWTSVVVIGGVLAVMSTGWVWLDPILAIAVAIHILGTGFQLVQRAMAGLMDAALPLDERDAIVRVLHTYEQAEGIQTHALRTRQGGARRFLSVHVLVPGTWTVQHGHDLLERIEHDLHALLAPITVFTHLEPIDDPRALEDIGLDRNDTSEPKKPSSA